MIERILSLLLEDAKKTAAEELSKLVVMDGATDRWALSVNEPEIFQAMIKEFKKGWNSIEELQHAVNFDNKEEFSLFRYIATAAQPFSSKFTGELPPRRFISKTGHLGITPMNVKAGDSIVVLAGAPKPSFIRRQGEGYLFMGNGYMRGITYGEISESSNFTEETIRII